MRIRKSRIVVVAVAGLVACAATAGLGAALVTSRYVPAVRQRPSMSKSDVRDDRVDQLERRMALLEGPATRSPLDTTPAAAENRQQVSSGAHPESAAPAKKPTNLPNPQEIADLIRSEPRDRNWAPDYEHAIATGFAASFPDAKVTDLKCATSGCRIEVENKTKEAQADFITKYWAALPAGSFAAVHHSTRKDENGDLIAELDLIRSGHLGTKEEQQ
jgi:hypothetical protein